MLAQLAQYRVLRCFIGIYGSSRVCLVTVGEFNEILHDRALVALRSAFGRPGPPSRRCCARDIEGGNLRLARPCKRNRDFCYPPQGFSSGDWKEETADEDQQRDLGEKDRFGRPLRMARFVRERYGGQQSRTTGGKRSQASHEFIFS